MKKIVKGKQCDTETATQLGAINVGEFGDATGYEEHLYITKSKQYFIYGNGGSESKYNKPTIDLFTNEEAEAWMKENNIKATATTKERTDKPKKSIKTKSTKGKTPRKPSVKKITEDK